MKYCPECEAEYFDTVEICADCEVRLISEQEYHRIKEEEERLKEILKTETFVPILTVENQFQVDRVKEILVDSGIPVLIKEFHDTAYDGIYVQQKGWAYIEVPERFVQKARELAGHLGQDFEVPVIEVDDDDTVLICSECGARVAMDDTVCPGCGEVLEGTD